MTLFEFIFSAPMTPANAGLIRDATGMGLTFSGGPGREPGFRAIDPHVMIIMSRENTPDRWSIAAITGDGEEYDAAPVVTYQNAVRQALETMGVDYIESGALAPGAGASGSDVGESLGQ